VAGIGDVTSPATIGHPVTPEKGSICLDSHGEFLYGNSFTQNYSGIAPPTATKSIGQAMSFIKQICHAIDTLNGWVGRGVAWVTLGLVVVVFVDVVMRYLFNTSFVFTQELEWHLFGFIFLIGAGYTLLQDGHVRVDIIYQRLGIRQRAWINLIGVIFFLIPGCLLVIATSWNFVVQAWSTMEGSPDPGGIPYRFLIKGTIPVGFSLLLLQGISLGLHSFLQLQGVETDKEPEA
jgi:TRAP-type mannitol/chloroaromatic compound transport system permease small subunit